MMVAVFLTRALLTAVLTLAFSAPVFATPVENARALPLSADAVLLLDPDGRTVYAKNAEFEHAPASLVKLMTLYLAFEDLQAGRVDLDEIVTVSRSAATVARYRMGLRAGDRVPVNVLFNGVAIASANDAATALAERLGGTEAEFVARMNAKAQTLGLSSTRFTNPTGLPDPRMRSSARDIAALITELLRTYPESRAMLGGQMFVWNGRVYARHIPLFHDPGGVQALKTGFTNEAGYNLAVSAWRAGQQFVMIVLGARSRALSYSDGQKLLRYGFVEAGLETPAPERPRVAHRTIRKVIRTRRVATK
jgi:D-alanyl-D-alanine carboxypeptidase